MLEKENTKEQAIAKISGKNLCGNIFFSLNIFLYSRNAIIMKNIETINKVVFDKTNEIKINPSRKNPKMYLAYLFFI